MSTITESTRLDKRDKAILQYIKEHDGPTENQIVKALHKQKISSKLTTLRRIKELKEKGEIKDLLKEGESGFHKLYINEKNEFNKIYDWLGKIDAVLDRMEKAISKMNREYVLGTEKPVSEAEDLLHLDEELRSIYIPMLEVITRRIDDKIQSSEDKYILQVKMIDLYRKISKQSFNLQKIDTLKKIIKRGGELKSNNDFKTRARKFGINVDSIDNTVKLAEDLRNETT